MRMAAQQKDFSKMLAIFLTVRHGDLPCDSYHIYQGTLEEKDTAVIGTVVLGTRYAVVSVRLIHLTYVLRKRKNEVDSSSLAVDFSLLEDGEPQARDSAYGFSSRQFRRNSTDSFGSDF